MNPSSPARITCEFESIDLADLNLSRLLKTTGGIRNVHVRRCFPPKHAPDLNRKSSVMQVFYPVMDHSFPCLFPAGRDSKDTIEPRQIRSVTAEIICNQKNIREITGRLTSLGASHIRIH